MSGGTFRLPTFHRFGILENGLEWAETSITKSRYRRKRRKLIPDLGSPMKEYYHGLEPSYWSGDKQLFTCSDDEQRNALLYKLWKEYGIYRMIESGPYLVLFGPAALGDAKRPFTITGSVAIWLQSLEDPMPPELDMGDMGDDRDDARHLQLTEALRNDLQPYRLPSTETLRAVGDYFPNAIAVTFLNSRVIVEMAPQHDTPFGMMANHLPYSIQQCKVRLHYYNGEIVSTEMEPEPKAVGSQPDNNNPPDNPGCPYPGSMLSADTGSSSSAGLLVQSGPHKRLTVSLQCWKEALKQHNQGLSHLNSFSVTHGCYESGKSIGRVTERIGSDIALATVAPGIEFRNNLRTLNSTAKTLISSKDLRMRDEFIVDTAQTGRLELKCQGLRVKFGNRPRSKRHFRRAPYRRRQSAVSTNPISEIQAIYASSLALSRPALTINGAPLIRSKTFEGDTINTMISTNVLPRGEVAGFMHFSRPLQPCYGDCDESDDETWINPNWGVRRVPVPVEEGGKGQLLVFCQVLDEIIRRGWKVVEGDENGVVEGDVEGKGKAKADC